jgi:death-on-curing protein
MSAGPTWISKKALLLLHEESLAEFGGARGVRDKGLLDSPLARPQNIHAYRSESTIAELAAADACGLAENHAFVDERSASHFSRLACFLGSTGIRSKPARWTLSTSCWDWRAEIWTKLVSHHGSRQTWLPGLSVQDSIGAAIWLGATRLYRSPGLRTSC